jgi:uncharacterized protein (DUF58 family)
LVVGSIWPWLSLCGLDGQLTYSASRGREQEALVVTLRLRNRCPWPAWCVTLDGACDPDDEAPVPAALPGWRRSELSCVVTPARRGVYPRGDAVLATNFPFGLWRRERRLRVLGEVVIWPRTFAGASPIDARADGCEGGLIELVRAGSGGEVLGARPYRRGDSLRRIHRAQSARYDRLIACERQRTVRIEALVVLDTEGQTHTRGGADGSQEWAVRVAASLGCRLLDEGIEVEAIVAGRVVRPAGADAERTWLDHLARLDADACPSLQSLLALPAARSKWGWQIVVTTAAAYARLPAAEINRDRRRFVVLGPPVRHRGAWADAESAGAEIVPSERSNVIQISDPREAPQALAYPWRPTAHAC